MQLRQRRVSYTDDQLIGWLQRQFPDQNWSRLKGLLPCVIWRHRWPQLAEKFGLPYSRGTIQNLDSRGDGPGSVEAEE